MEKTKLGDISVVPQSDDARSNLFEDRDRRNLEELAKYPKSLLGIAYTITENFIENLEFQIKFTTDLTKFLKREVRAVDELKRTYETLQAVREKINQTYLSDPEAGIKNINFRESLKEFLAYFYNDNNGLIRGILAKDMILLRTLISDMQSLMIENISIYLNNKNKNKQ
jgi:hypothetical protein